MGDVVNILAIETATPACAVALRTGDGRERALVVDLERHHTEALAPGIDRLLRDAGLPAKSIDRIVVDRGPGLFTGLRVGLATAVGLALGASADLVTVTSLEVLAQGAFSAGVRGRLVCAVDARRGELFIQSFELDDQVRALDEAMVSRPNELVTTWASRGVAVTFSGDGAARYAGELGAVATGSLFDQLVPSPLEALHLGATREPLTEVLPLYLREADAVANFSTRERSR